MRPEVRDGFVAFTERFEGSVPFLYLDVKGLCTTAIGNLVDPLETAYNLPLMRPDGTLASHQEIAAEWHAVKARQDMRLQGGMAYRAVTQLRLTPAGIGSVVLGKLAQVEEHLAGRFPEWESWPWQAQLGVLSVSWACGPAFHFPHFEMALRTQDWALAAVECHLDDSSNPGLRPRNAANKALFLEAAALLDGPVAFEVGEHVEG